MKKLLFFIIFAVLGQSAWAVPAWRRWHQFSQSDGSEITVQLQGDERAHWFVTADMKVVARTQNGDFRYVLPAAQPSEGFTVSEVCAHNADTRSDAERAFADNHALSPAAFKQFLEKNTHVQPRLTQAHKVARRSKFEGKRRGLFILVEFNDIKFSRPDIHQVYDSICNYSGYNTSPFKESVGDYFREQSDGRFVADSVNWADYDWNNDGEADQVFLLYAGYGEAQYGPEWTIWPCEGKLTTQHYSPLEFDGITVNTFACSCELHGNKGTQLDGIGTICHEFSHCMGLPDFYNTSDMSDFCMDAMDLMDQGAYNGKGGYSPAAYTGYERWYCGWRTPVALSEPQQIDNWQPLESGGETYILYNQADSTEYYLIDNRQRVGFDEGLYSCGLVVTHVHYDADAWDQNSVNTNKDHKRMALLPADGIYDYNTCNTDAFPYYYMNGQRCLDSLTDNTHPRTTLYVENTDGTHKLGKPIYKITQNDDQTMSFSFMTKPVADDIRNIPTHSSGMIYNLSGQPLGTDLQRLPAGIYIREGRKIVK